MMGNVLGRVRDILLEVRTPLLKWRKAFHVGIKVP